MQLFLQTQVRPFTVSCKAVLRWQGQMFIRRFIQLFLRRRVQLFSVVVAAGFTLTGAAVFTDTAAAVFYWKVQLFYGGRCFFFTDSRSAVLRGV